MAGNGPCVVHEFSPATRQCVYCAMSYRDYATGRVGHPDTGIVIPDAGARPTTARLIGDQTRLVWMTAPELTSVIVGARRLFYASGEPLPPDLEVVSASWSTERNMLGVVVHSNAFEANPREGYISPLYTRLKE